MKTKRLSFFLPAIFKNHFSNLLTAYSSGNTVTTCLLLSLLRPTSREQQFAMSSSTTLALRRRHIKRPWDERRDGFGQCWGHLPCRPLSIISSHSYPTYPAAADDPSLHIEHVSHAASSAFAPLVADVVFACSAFCLKLESLSSTVSMYTLLAFFSIRFDFLHAPLFIEPSWKRTFSEAFLGTNFYCTDFKKI